MEAHDDQTVSNRTWRLVGLEAPFSSLTFQEVLAFYQTPHSLSKAPLVEGGKCDMRRCTWCRGSMSWYQQQRKEKGEKNVLVDVTRRGGSGGWTAGGSDEDRCRLILSTLTEFVFHGALAEEAG